MKQDLYLVNFEKETLKKVEGIEYDEKATDFKIVEDTLLPYCDKYSKELKNGYWLISSIGINAKFRASYAKWMEECEEHPYYIDVAEGTERYMFAQVFEKSV